MSQDDYIEKCIKDYNETGRCGSVMFSTVEFIPVIAELREKLKESAKDSKRLLALIEVTENEGKNGKFKVSLEYDNYQDGVWIRNADGKIIADCYSLNPEGSPDPEPKQEAEWQFRKAIDNLIDGVKPL